MGGWERTNKQNEIKRDERAAKERIPGERKLNVINNGESANDT